MYRFREVCVLAWLLFLLIFLCSCTICRVTAIQDAERYQANGYAAKVCTYDMTLPGRAYGGFVWTHHAQACVWKDGKMLWAGMLGLSEEPTFRVKTMVVQWTIDEYKAAIGQ